MTDYELLCEDIIAGKENTDSVKKHLLIAVSRCFLYSKLKR